MPWSGADEAVPVGGCGPVEDEYDAAAAEPTAFVVESAAAMTGVGVLRPLPPHGFMEPSSVVFSGFLSTAGGPIALSASCRSLRREG